MFERFYPITSYAGDKLRRSTSHVDLAVSYEILHESEDGQTRGADISADDRARITGTSPMNDFAEELGRLDSKPIKHRATIRRVYRNVLATPSGVFCLSKSIYRVKRPSLRNLFDSDLPKLDKGFLPVRPAAIGYFGHWVIDSLPATYLRREDEELYLPYAANWSHAATYLEALDLRPFPSQTVFFRQMAVVEDVSSNTGKRERLRRIRSHMRSTVSKGTARRVFLRRAATGERRNIANDEAFETFLRTNGFTIVSVESPLSEILAATRDAEICISVEGSHIANAVLGMSSDALLLVLVPADRMNGLFIDYCEALGNRISMVTVERQKQDYIVDIKRVGLAMVRNGIEINPSFRSLT